MPGTGVPAREATAELAGFGRFVPQHFGNAGFLIHQLLSAEPELDGSAPDRRQTIAAYQAHLARRIHYSGPVRPVDLLI